MAAVDGWETPPGNTLIRRTRYPTVCHICKRSEPTGATVLANRNGQTRCVDTGDCADIVKLGRWPTAQKPLMALADALDRGYRITR